MKRLLLYVHYNKSNELSGHVLYQLEQLRPFFSKLVVISNSHLSELSVEALGEIGISDIIQRNNIGFDFAAWRDGMAYVGFSQLSHFDSLTLMNDTCFGPLWDLGESFNRFENLKDVDFWGMTNFRKTRYFVEHLQSYFMTFKSQVVSSQTFQKFWSTIEDFTEVQDVIDNYESKFTSIFLEAGFHYDAVFNTITEDAEDLIHPDFSYYKPFTILEHKVPFIKVKVFKDNERLGKPLLSVISEKTDFPVSLIKQHINHYLSLDSLSILDDKMISVENSMKAAHLYQLAIHIHVTNISKLQLFLDKQIPAYYYFTVSDEVDRFELKNLLKTRFKKDYQLISGTATSHYQALFSLLDQLKSFDFIGHFHTDTLTDTSRWLDEQIRFQAVNPLLNHGDVQAIFNHLPDVGLVFSDLSEYSYLTTALNPLTSEEEERLDDIGEKSFSNHPLQIFEGFFWFSNAFLEQVLLKDTQILSRLEDRLLNYAFYLKAWDRGIDYRIIQSNQAAIAEQYKLDLVKLSEIEPPRGLLLRTRDTIVTLINNLLKKA